MPDARQRLLDFRETDESALVNSATKGAFAPAKTPARMF